MWRRSVRGQRESDKTKMNLRGEKRRTRTISVEECKRRGKGEWGVSMQDKLMKL